MLFRVPDGLADGDDVRGRWRSLRAAIGRRGVAADRVDCGLQGGVGIHARGPGPAGGAPVVESVDADIGEAILVQGGAEGAFQPGRVVALFVAAPDIVNVDTMG